MLLTLLFVVMLLFMMLGADIGVSMGIACLTYIVLNAIQGTSLPIMILPQKMVNGVDSFPMLAVPLFMLAGELMNRGGVTLRLVRFATVLVGHLTGGLANVVVVSNMIMAGMSGSAIADATATGSVLIPAMKKAGYPARFSAAVVGAASTIGPIIPPSIPMVLIGSMVEVSVARLFVGGAIPGILIGLALMGTIRVISKRNNYPVELRASCGQMLVSTKESILALLMPLVVIGAIVTGAATPTEAAMIGVWYALILGAFVYKEIKLADMSRIIVGTAVSSGAVMFTVSTATVMGWIATSEGLGSMLTQWMLSITDNSSLILLMMMVILLILGCLMEPIPILVLMTPILFPVVTTLGIDPVHFGILVTVNVTIGMLTPPVGLTLFVMSAISKESIGDVAKAMAPFLVTLIISLLFLTYVPQITLWLPNLIMGAAK